MFSRAWHIGIGVSTLETPAGPWLDILHQAPGPLAVPGCGHVLLADGTRLTVERGATAGSARLYSSQPLTDPMNPARPWRWLRDTQGHRQLWHGLHQP